MEQKVPTFSHKAFGVLRSGCVAVWLKFDNAKPVNGVIISFMADRRFFAASLSRESMGELLSLSMFFLHAVT